MLNMSGAKENTKKDKKPNVEKYHYFKTNVKIGDKIYEIIFDTEEYKNENQLRSDYAKRSFKETEADTNSITDNAADINQYRMKIPKVRTRKPCFQKNTLRILTV